MQWPVKNRRAPRMANPKHLEILKEGVSAWNQWRRENAGRALGPRRTVNLYGAGRLLAASCHGDQGLDLTQADLLGGHLSGADFGGVDLTAATLRAADLSRANLISYSSKDDEFARRLHANLQQANVRCWKASEDLKIGDRFRVRIEESIRRHDKLMVILTENSIASPWVEEEVEAALEKEHKHGKLLLFPIRLDDTVMETDQAWAASLRRTRHIGDFRNWKNHDAFQKAFERLLRDLKAGEAAGH
jgi:TIR domain/Pentapeptide repeats (8 copies)